MTGMPRRRFGGGDDRVRADVAVDEVTAVAGETATVSVEITNVDDVIRSFRVAVLGIDSRWVQVDRPTVDLFPDERQPLEISLHIPEDFSAGRRRIAITVMDADGDGSTAVMTSFDLVLAARETLEVSAEPGSLTVGKEGTFVINTVNTGNTTIDLALTVQEPERKVAVSFEPAENQLLPGERCLVTAFVQGERPWFGSPVVRMLEVTAGGAVATAMTMVMLVQKPRISRRVLSLIGLVLIATLFAFVIMLAFNGVAERAEANELLLKQGLGEDGPVGVRTAPASVSGQISSTTGGPLDGAAVELFDPASLASPVHATVTNAAGRYRFGSLREGEYLLRVEVAGFDEVWFPEAALPADARPLELGPGTELEDIDIAVAGRPGSASGIVLGADVEGAVVRAQIPADAIEGSELEPTAAELTSVEVDATGRFVLPELATPATYEIVVAKPGFATEVRTVSLSAGEQRDGLEILLRTGDGRIAGTIVDTAGVPVPNAQITATDGTATSQTRSLSGDGAEGTFELRDLPTPAAFTVSVSAEGYFPESVTLQLDEQQQIDDLQVILTSDVGSLSGRVTSPDGTPLGGVDVIIDGGDDERMTVSLSSGDVGSWLATDLPVPGEYTVTFSREGLTTQALSVELLSGPEGNRSGVDVVLSAGTASVRGVVAEPGGQPIGGVSITLESSTVERATRSSDRPPGAYGFDELPPGAYTVTYDRAGSRSQTLLIDLDAGQTLTLPTIELEAQAGISGFVTTGGVGQAGVGIVVYPLDQYPNVVVAETISTAGGAYELIGLEAPETYVIEFQVPAGGAVVKSETIFLQAGEAHELDVEL